MPKRRMRKPLLLAVAVALGVGSGIGAGLALGRSPAHTRRSAVPHSQAQWPAHSRRAPDFALRDQHGRVVSLRAFRGRVVMLTFLDSRCRATCPIEARELTAVGGRLAGAARPVLVVVGVDPWGDTPRTERAFAARARWAMQWHWLEGAPASLRPVWRRYGIVVKPLKRDIAHSNAVYLIDRDGYERAGYLIPFTPSDVAHDVRLLAAT